MMTQKTHSIAGTEIRECRLNATALTELVQIAGFVLQIAEKPNEGLGGLCHHHGPP